MPTWRKPSGIERGDGLAVSAAGDRAFASPEVASFWRFIVSSLDRLMAIVGGCSVDELNYRPPVEGANSLLVLGIHTLSNAQENILRLLCGEPVERVRDAEFDAVANEDNVPIAWWPDLRKALERALSSVPAGDLDRVFDHPRREPMLGREILIVVARHAAEHLGQAELTRDLALAAESDAGNVAT